VIPDSSTRDPLPNSSALEPPVLGSDGRILEGIVSTLDGTGQPHIAPMGPLVDEALNRLWLRPFATSTTFQNLRRTGVGVFHVTDDVELLARAAVGQLPSLPRLIQAEAIPGVVLADACRWYAFEVELIDASHERTSVAARVVDRGILREFLGFNRAKHAVVEAAILATRTHLLDSREILAEFERLAIPVAKTGAAAERRAFDFLRAYVQAQSAAAAQ
jgi:uncharacterized protein